MLVALGPVSPTFAAEDGSSSAPKQEAPVPSEPVRSVVEEDEEAAPPGLDREVIMDVIQSRMSAIKHCYIKELRKDPALAGTVLVKFTVDPKGKVSTAEVNPAKSTLKNKEVESCMVTEIKTWIFPEPRGGISVDINYPFKFKSGG